MLSTMNPLTILLYMLSGSTFPTPSFLARHPTNGLEQQQQRSHKKKEEEK